jgi:hypothetical protein
VRDPHQATLAMVTALVGGTFEGLSGKLIGNFLLRSKHTCNIYNISGPKINLHDSCFFICDISLSYQATSDTTPPASLIFALKMEVHQHHKLDTHAQQTYSAFAETNRAFTMKGSFGSLI